MNNREIAAMLFNIATLLKRQEANPYRIRAYRRAARRILRLPYQLTERIAAEKPLGVPGLGRSLTEKLTELLKTGKMSFYDDLCAELPAREQALMRVSGIGPILAQRISSAMGEADLASLVRQAAADRLQEIWGVGPARAAAIVNAVLPNSQDLPPTDDVALPIPQRDNIIYVQPTLWGERPPLRRAA